MAEPNDPQSVNYVNGSDIQSDAAKSASDFASGPLGSLFQSIYNYNSIQYPADLNSVGKGHAIVFEISQPKSKSIQDVIDYSVKTATEVGTAVRNKVKELNAMTDAQSEAALTQLGTDVKNGVTSLLNGNAFGTTAAELMSVQKELKAVVSLYMPDSLSFQYAADYNEETIMGAASSLPGILGKVPGFVQSVMNNPAAKLALNKMGYAFNPQSQVLFQGIDFRTFEMSFTFSPKSSREAEQVQKIIKLFRSYAAPTIVTGAAGFFYTPPGVFNLSFRKDGRVNPNINKLTDCVLQNVTVNYAPNGWSSYKDGQPTQTTMDLSFKETVLVDRAKIEQGY